MRKKKKLWLIPVGTVLVFVLVFTVLAANALQRKHTKPAGKASDGTNTTIGQISWNGKQYTYNDHRSNFLFLGIDKEKTQTQKGQADAGQSDVLALLSWDRVTKDLTLVSIPRDTMTEIETFDLTGKSLGNSKDHISLAYAYGDGRNESCELSVQAVEKLFYGIRIQGYCAVNLDGIPLLTEAVQGVTVTVPDDSLEAAYPEFQAGAQVELTPENTEAFVRYRDITESQSALRRMKRQNEFMNAYADKAQDTFLQNPGFITDLYEDLQPYMVTNIGVDQLAKIMQDLIDGGKVEKWTVPGEGVEGVSFDEYHVDDGKLYEQIIKTFYREAVK